MSTAQKLADFAHVAGEISGRNRIINGGFDIWQRGAVCPDLQGLEEGT